MLEGSSPTPDPGPLDAALRRRGLRVAVAESCTGGLLAAALTDLPGSSDYFLGGLVTYANEAKMALLGVPEVVLREHGAVSAEVAELMALGARRVFGADLGIGVTGIAGPDSDATHKPVGLTYIAAALDERVEVRQFNWTADRPGNRARSVEAALQLATGLLS